MSKASVFPLLRSVSNIGVYRKPQELVDLVTTSRTVLSSFAKAKTAKLGIL